MSRSSQRRCGRAWLAPLLLSAALLAPAPALAQSSGVVNVPANTALTVEQEREVERIGMKIHCPICSGESIAQSQTDISRNMLNQVRDLVRQGESESEILGFFRQSYGDRILLEPPKRGLTSLLWTLPVVFLGLGLGLWWSYLRRASRVPAKTLTPEEEARIRELLREDHDR